MSAVPNPLRPEPTTTRSPQTHLIPRLSVAVLLFMVSFVWLYLAAFHDPKPNGVEVAVVGPPEMAQQLQARADQAGAGGLEFVGYRSAEAARAAVLDQDVQGALLAREGAPRLLVASGGSFMIAQAIEAAVTRATAAAGAELEVEDVRPLPPGDSRGLSVVFLTIGLAIPAVALGALLWALGGRLPASRMIGGLAAFALAAGLCAAFTADTLVGALSGAFWEVALLAALLVLAVAATVAGLGRLLGAVAIPTALLLFVLLGLSSSGGPVGHLMLPDFFRAISQFLPVGAAITAVRDTVYFDGAQTLAPVVVLSCWALAGLTMLAVGRHPGLATRPAAAVAAAH